MRAVWQGATEGAAEVVLADNSAGRSATEKIFEGWWPGPASQEVQDEARVDSDSRFVEPRGNITRRGRLRVAWGFESVGRMAAAAHELPDQLKGRGTLRVEYPDGSAVLLENAAFERIEFAEVFEVRWIAELFFKGESSTMEDAGPSAARLENLGVTI